MAEQIINLSLTVDEVLMIQELVDTRSLDTGYKWEMDIAEGLEKKARMAYKKPTMSLEEYNEELYKERSKWADVIDVATYMERARKRELNFRYEIEEKEDGYNKTDIRARAAVAAEF